MGRLFWKFFFAYWLALLAAGAGVGAGVALYERARVQAQPLLLASPRYAFMVDSAASTLEHGGEAALRALLSDWHAQGQGRVYAVDEQGRELIGREVPPASLGEARKAPSGAPGEGVRRARDASGNAWLLYAPADSGSAPARRRRPPPAALPIAAGIIASLAVSALLAWYVSHPIGHLRGAFAQLARGRFETRVQPLMGRRRDELASLGEDFDRMAQKLQALIDSQRRLLHDVSHELRSPLARLQVAVGLARQNPQKIDASLDRIERESARLDTLVGELLTLSRLEAGTSDHARQRIDLNELVEAIAEDARFEARASGRDLDFEGDGEMVAAVHGELMHRAFENVIRNAVKFTAPGTRVEVRIQRLAAPDRMRLTVSDRGPGVPAQESDSIFEPFYRSADGAGTAGFGLGLAIARRALEAHGGAIHASARDGGGLVMEISLPLAESGTAAATGQPGRRVPDGPTG